ncbi:TPA: hypothetical protein QDZ84_003492 [Shewanella algae]|nr:hypothetical protein [Shewanella sp. Iso12]NJI86959.1 hypothetical protein [Shewanella sp. Iso12]HDS1208453.1 hypothetical protein [Shewanella algae]
MALFACLVNTGLADNSVFLLGKVEGVKTITGGDIDQIDNNAVPDVDDVLSAIADRAVVVGNNSTTSISLLSPDSLTVNQGRADDIVPDIDTSKELLFVAQRDLEFQSILAAWARQAGYKEIAWAKESNFRDSLRQVNEETQMVRGTFEEAVESISKSTDGLSELTLTVSGNGVVAYHPYRYRPVSIIRIHGNTLKEAVMNAVTDLGLVWLGDNYRLPSWQTTNNYQFGSPYSIVVPSDNLISGIDQILEHYPVRSEIVLGTDEVYILEDKKR